LTIALVKAVSIAPPQFEHRNAALLVRYLSGGGLRAANGLHVLGDFDLSGNRMRLRQDSLHTKFYDADLRRRLRLVIPASSSGHHEVLRRDEWYRIGNRETELMSTSTVERSVLLCNVREEVFEALSAVVADDGHARMCYDRGTLEIVSPSIDHELCKRLLEQFVDMISQELKIPVGSVGSTTFRIPSGFCEPDGCFYIANEPAVRGKRKVDLAFDPPPDIVVEIDLSRQRMEKDELYARMAVPEIWNYDGTTLRARRLVGTAYHPIDCSVSFPWLLVNVIAEFLERRGDTAQSEIVWAFRDFVRANTRLDF
jgi:Uma2 family endonuclease